MDFKGISLKIERGSGAFCGLLIIYRVTLPGGAGGAWVWRPPLLVAGVLRFSFFSRLGKSHFYSRGSHGAGDLSS